MIRKGIKLQEKWVRGGQQKRFQSNFRYWKADEQIEMSQVTRET